MDLKLVSFFDVNAPHLRENNTKLKCLLRDGENRDV